MGDIKIRPFQSGDDQSVELITYRTGYKGEDLTRRGFFDDRRLLYLIFIAYYTKYEAKHCFVAESTPDNQVVGFICGTLDTQTQEKEFSRLMHWRIALRACTITIWRYPMTFVNLIKMSKTRPGILHEEFSKIIDNYPAHLHINLLPEYQRKGYGGRLIVYFENHLRAKGIQGVHLQTTNYNRKAIPFYRKMGYTLISDVPMKHFSFTDIRLLTFGKRLSGIMGKHN